MTILFVVLLLVVVSVGVVGCVLVLKKMKIGYLAETLDMVLFSVKMPKYEQEGEKEKQDIKSIIGMMEQVYSNFLNLREKNFIKRIFYPAPRIALEIASETGGQDIVFYVAVPSGIETNLEKYIQGVYPGAVLQKIPKDYTIFEVKGRTAGSYLKFGKSVFFPINTYKNLEGDPLSSITNALSKINPDEGAAVQIMLKPSSFDIRGKGSAILAKIAEGKTLESAVASAQQNQTAKILSSILEMILSPKKKDEIPEKPKEKVVDDVSVEAIKTKIQKPVFDANIRLVGAAQTQERAEEILQHLGSGFAQFASNFNSIDAKAVKPRFLKKFIFDFSFRNFNNKQNIILNLEELSSMYHFPSTNIESPDLQWAKTKEAPPPTEIQEQGVNLIGKALFRGDEKNVCFANREDRRRHFYIVGQTGTGKSALLQEIIRQDIENGEGVGVIDPHGDLIENVLANIPKDRIEDVVLFEPSDLEMPCGLNMLEWNTPEQKDFAVSEMIAIFSKLFPPEIIGPMFEHYMRNAMLALMADKDNPGTLVDIPRIFTDKEFMEKRLAKVSDPLVKQFWAKEWAQTTGETRSDMLGYVVSKVGRFIENEMMRNIIGQQKSGFDLAKIMDEKKIFLANLSKGQTGELNSALLGLILVSKMQIAAMRRGTMPEEQRKDFYLYIDEFQNFTTDTIAIILSEARKYRLNLILAHQFMPQLTEEIKNAVIGNAGTIGAFRIGAVDAEFLEKQFEPEFSKRDLVNLDNFQFIVKMMINNKISSPFKVNTIKPLDGNPQAIDSIKRISKLKYSRQRILVEREIMERMKL